MFSASNPPIPVNIMTNSTSSTVPMQSFPNRVLVLQNPSRELFDFDGIQYSRYFLTSGDNPGISIISEVLDGSNYNTWSIAKTVVLDAKNKLSFVDGSLPRPSETHPYYHMWSRCNSMVKSWILTSVTK